MALVIHWEPQDEEWLRIAEVILSEYQSLAAQDISEEQMSWFINAVGEIGYKLGQSLMPVKRKYPEMVRMMGKCIMEDQLKQEATQREASGKEGE